MPLVIGESLSQPRFLQRFSTIRADGKGVRLIRSTRRALPVLSPCSMMQVSGTPIVEWMAPFADSDVGDMYINVFRQLTTM